MVHCVAPTVVRCAISILNRTHSHNLSFRQNRKWTRAMVTTSRTMGRILHLAFLSSTFLNVRVEGASFLDQCNLASPQTVDAQQSVVNLPCYIAGVGVSATCFFSGGLLFGEFCGSAPSREAPTEQPSGSPSALISEQPSEGPSAGPTVESSANPSAGPTATASPSAGPTATASAPPSGVEAPEFQPGNTFPALFGQTSNMFSQGYEDPQDAVCGAVQSVLTHPSNVDICFAGATNGGVWRTTTCTSAFPVWTPLTDGEDSLSVGDMVYDQDDTSGNTIVVAVGARSSFSRIGGARIGLLKTTNALDEVPTWTVLDNSGGLINFTARGVYFRSLFVRGDLMLAAAYNSRDNFCDETGIFRSTDGGVTWTNVVNGVGLEIAADPNDPDRFYAALDFLQICAPSLGIPSGVITSNDMGATWTATADVATQPYNQGELNNAKLSVSASDSRVWAALLRNGVADAISYSDDNGASWTTMDPALTPNEGGDPDGLNPREKPGSQGAIHFSLLVSPTNSDEVYVGGDRQNTNAMGDPFPNFIGATDFTGRLFRGDASIAGTMEVPSPQWEHMTDSAMVAEIPEGGTIMGSAPHADSRDMELRLDGSLLEGNDGGISLRTNPGNSNGDWFGLCGNMQVFETHNVAYEPILKTIIFGNQDTGTIFGFLGFSDTFQSITTADGNNCMIDFSSDLPNIHYYFGFQFSVDLRLTINSETQQVVSFIQMPVPGDGQFVTPAEMNPADRAQLAIEHSGTRIGFSVDRGLSFADIDSGLSDTIQAMAWSHDGAVLYAVDFTNDVSACDNTGSNLICSVVGSAGNLPQASIAHMAVNPSDSDTIVGVQMDFDFSNPTILLSVDGGVNWSEITVLGSPVALSETGGAVAYIADVENGGFKVLVGTNRGIFIEDGGLGVGWRLLAQGLPTVPVLDLLYEAMDDTVVVATLGRGVWFLNNAQNALSPGASPLFESTRPASSIPRDMILGLGNLNDGLLVDFVPPDDFSRDASMPSDPKG